MVVAVILAAGLLWCIALVLEHINRPSQDQILMETRAYDEALRADLEAWARGPEGQAILDTAIAHSVEREQAREREKKAKRLAIAMEKKRVEAERKRAEADKSSAGIVADVTDALAAWGWPRSRCRELARNAVRALGPKESIENLTVYALTHKEAP